MSKVQSIEQIIMDWWYTVAPDGKIPRDERLPSYIELFMQIKNAGHDRSDILIMHRQDVIKKSVNMNYKNKKNLKMWMEMVKVDLERAEVEVFAEFKGITSEAHEKAQTIQKEVKKVVSSTPLPEIGESDELDSSEYTLFKPNLDSGEQAFSMDYINENYDFDIDPDRLEKLDGGTDE